MTSKPEGSVTSAARQGTARARYATPVRLSPGAWQRAWHSRWLPFVSTPIIVVVAIVIWWAYTRISGISPLILPGPWAVAQAFGSQITTGYIWTREIWTTFEETILGFIIGFVVGVGAGYVMGRVRPLEAMGNPFVVTSQVVPKVALVPLFVLWFGFGTTSKIAIAATLSFFPLLTNTSLGIRSVSPSMNEMMASMRASRLQRFIRLEVPQLLPYVLAGSEVAMVLSLIGAIVGEYLAGDEGLGRLAVDFQNNLQIPQLYGSILIMTLLGFVLYLVIAVLRRFLIPWHDSVLVRQNRDQS